MARKVWQEARFRWRLFGALIGAAALLGAALVFDAGGTAVNGIANVFLASTVTVTYHFWVSHRRRRKAENKAWRALLPLHKQLKKIEDEVQNARDQLLVLTADCPDQLQYEHRLWLHHIWLGRNPRLELVIAYDHLRALCPGPGLDEHVDKVGHQLDKVVSLDLQLGLSLDDLKRVTERESSGLAEQFGAATASSMAAIGGLIERLDTALPKLGRARDALFVRAAYAYYPAAVAKRTTPDPLPPPVFRSSVVVGVVSALVWLGGVWPGRYAADVLDNVLVGLSAILIGVGFATVLLLRRHNWLTGNAAQPKRDLDWALGDIRFWARSGARGEWQRKRSNPEDQAFEDARIKDVQLARPRLRGALYQLQHIAPDPRLDAVRDQLDELITQGLNERDNARLMWRIAAAIERLEELVEQLFPPPYREYLATTTGPAYHDMPDSRLWDADLDRLSPKDVPDPSAGPWRRRVDDEYGDGWI